MGSSLSFEFVSELSQVINLYSWTCPLPGLTFASLLEWLHEAHNFLQFICSYNSICQLVTIILIQIYWVHGWGLHSKPVNEEVHE